jgi:hypothetical protein
MPLELRDPTAGVLVGSYTTIDAMLAAVRGAVAAHGAEHVGRWELLLSNEYGGARAALQGAALVQRALEAPSDEQAWYDANRLLLEDAYLATDDARRGSGFGGDADRWRHARGPIAEAIHRDGTFLDVCCANGLLMESIVAWAAVRGYRVEPYGLDISSELAELARRRLPV